MYSDKKFGLSSNLIESVKKVLDEAKAPRAKKSKATSPETPADALNAVPTTKPVKVVGDELAGAARTPPPAVPPTKPENYTRVLPDAPAKAVNVGRRPKPGAPQVLPANPPAPDLGSVRPGAGGSTPSGSPRVEPRFSNPEPKGAGLGDIRPKEEMPKIVKDMEKAKGATSPAAASAPTPKTGIVSKLVGKVLAPVGIAAAGYSAYQNAKQGNYKDAALDAAEAIPVVGLGVSAARGVADAKAADAETPKRPQYVIGGSKRSTSGQTGVLKDMYSDLKYPDGESEPQKAERKFTQRLAGVDPTLRPKSTKSNEYGGKDATDQDSAMLGATPKSLTFNRDQAEREAKQRDQEIETGVSGPNPKPTIRNGDPSAPKPRLTQVPKVKQQKQDDQIRDQLDKDFDKQSEVKGASEVKTPETTKTKGLAAPRLPLGREMQGDDFKDLAFPAPGEKLALDKPTAAQKKELFTTHKEVTTGKTPVKQPEKPALSEPKTEVKPPESPADSETETPTAQTAPVAAKSEPVKTVKTPKVAKPAADDEGPVTGSSGRQYEKKWMRSALEPDFGQEDGGPSKKGKRKMSESSLINAFLKLHETKEGNLFAKVKQDLQEKKKTSYEDSYDVINPETGKGRSVTKKDMENYRFRDSSGQDHTADAVFGANPSAPAINVKTGDSVIVGPKGSRPGPISDPEAPKQSSSPAGDDGGEHHYINLPSKGIVKASGRAPEDVKSKTVSVVNPGGTETQATYSGPEDIEKITAGQKPNQFASKGYKAGQEGGLSHMVNLPKAGLVKASGRAPTETVDNKPKYDTPIYPSNPTTNKVEQPKEPDAWETGKVPVLNPARKRKPTTPIAKGMTEDTTFVNAFLRLHEKKHHKLDKVGKEDDDINNDGKKDETDSYLKKRREAIGAAIKGKHIKEASGSVGKTGDDLTPGERNEIGYLKGANKKEGDKVTNPTMRELDPEYKRKIENQRPAIKESKRTSYEDSAHERSTVSGYPMPSAETKYAVPHGFTRAGEGKLSPMSGEVKRDLVINTNKRGVDKINAVRKELGNPEVQENFSQEELNHIASVLEAMRYGQEEQRSNKSSKDGRSIGDTASVNTLTDETKPCKCKGKCKCH